MKIKILDNEFWYGGAVEHSKFLPFDKKSVYEIDLRVNKTYNQASALFLSSHGRFIYSEKGFKISVENGVIRLDCLAELIFENGHGTLAGAYKAFASNHMKIANLMPNRIMFERPQYCTWIELKYEQSQKGVIEYARSIVDSGMPSGEIIIDDCWQRDYGDWEFNPLTFPNPKQMVEELNSLGFEVILWICPYVSPDSYITREVMDKNNLLIKLPNGETSIHHWWNGYSAMLDMTNPKARNFLKAQMDNLATKYNIKGFKMDAGDAFYHNESEQKFEQCEANESTKAWAEFARAGEFNELRASFNGGGLGVTQRLCDKFHCWQIDNGLKCLIPSAIACSLLGHSFLCPDMIGGGLWTNFLEGQIIDEELLIRWLQVSTLMPMMQFSYAIWAHASKKAKELCVKYSQLHIEFSNYILELAKNAKTTAMPIIRSLEFEFPHSGYEDEKTMFMLGDKYLVAPVLEKGQTVRLIKVPAGKWRDISGNIIEGNQEISVKAEIEDLPYLEKID